MLLIYLFFEHYIEISGGKGGCGSGVVRFLLTQCHAPVHEFPSTKMYCEVAPAARMALIAAWFRFATSVLSSSWNSLFVSNMTFELDA